MPGMPITDRPVHPSVSSNINNVRFSSGTLELLSGFDDYDWLANGGLDIPGASMSRQEQEDLLSSSQRIIEPLERQEFLNRCGDLRRIDFEDQPGGHGDRPSVWPACRVHC